MDQSIMEYRTLEIKMISAKDVKDVTPFFQKLKVFAYVSIKGDPLNPQTEVTDADGYNKRNPEWNSSLKFTFKESLANQDRLFLKIHLGAKLNFPNKLIGTVNIPLKELFDNPAGHQLSYQVRKINSEKSRGTLNLSYKLGDRPPPPKTMKEPVKAPDIPGDPEACNDVDTLVEKLVDELAVEEPKGSLIEGAKDQAIHVSEIVASLARPASGVQLTVKVDGTMLLAQKTCSTLKEVQLVEGHATHMNDSPPVVVESRCQADVGRVETLKEKVIKPINMPLRKCMSSCHPEAGWSMVSGPWSLEWLSNQHHGDAGVISSSKKMKKSVERCEDGHNYEVELPKRKKVGRTSTLAKEATTKMQN
uniref:C2 n=1 Tax=Medicago truncatula TaxID=3880 RepID=A2Q683_MEDTR|nr:C2 [Medicago truncatula]